MLSWASALLPMVLTTIGIFIGLLAPTNGTVLVVEAMAEDKTMDEDGAVEVTTNTVLFPSSAVDDISGNEGAAVVPIVVLVLAWPPSNCFARMGAEVFARIVLLIDSVGEVLCARGKLLTAKVGGAWLTVVFAGSDMKVCCGGCCCDCSWVVCGAAFCWTSAAFSKTLPPGIEVPTGAKI